MSVSANSLCAASTEASAQEHVNRLACESSPYLLQHACNPVDWFPWSEEALRRARREQKPIFLSIGYSACHWCHVMERESFEDEETARILNEHFIAVKVDREEHPELDEIYMAAVQMMTGGGGWPLSVFLTPELAPFFGGTYFPPKDSHGLPSFKTVLRAVAQLWRTQPDRVVRSAGDVVGALTVGVARTSSRGETIEPSMLADATAELKLYFDPVWGGFGRPPKFPDTAAIGLLLRQHRHTGDEHLLEMATATLDHMAYGGIHDQIGGGFHRYAVDARWLTPHFEKMLYDNASLARTYLEAWQATGRGLYRRVAADTLDYVLREMSDARGGFHASQDADSEQSEGKFYLWRPGEIEAVLGPEDGGLACQYYGVSEHGNFESGNILHVPQEPAVFARRHEISEEQLHARLAPLRRRLLAERSRRVPPGKDDKVLAAWNGMMISALSRGYQVLGETRYLEAAERAANFVLSEMVRDGVLLRARRTCGDGRGMGHLPGYLDDYAEVSCAMVDLYEASFERRWLAAADRLVRRMLADFWDEQQGGFYYTSAAHAHLLVRTKPVCDGPVPSGNATAALVLLRLSKLLDSPDYLSKAETLLVSTAHGLRSQPRVHLRLLAAADFYLDSTCEIAIAGPRDGDDTRRLLDVVHRKFIPNKILALAEPDADSARTEPAIPLLAGKSMLSGRATAYVCHDFSCGQPVTDVTALERMLDR
jgi:uncharacterized protein